MIANQSHINKFRICFNNNTNFQTKKGKFIHNLFKINYTTINQKIRTSIYLTIFIRFYPRHYYKKLIFLL